MQGEIDTSSRLYTTLLGNKNQKGFQTIDKRGDGHNLWIHVMTSLMYWENGVWKVVVKVCFSSSI
jgi:hypothetical protein